MAVAALLAVGLMLPSFARSATVVDSFDTYTPATALAGQNGGSGWSAAWGTPEGNVANVVDTSVVGELNFSPTGGATISGGSRAVDFSGTAAAFAATRQLASAQTGTFYVRCLLKWNAGTYSTGNSFYLLLNSSGTSDTANGFNFGYRANADVGSVYFVRHGTSTPPGGGYAALTAANAANTHCLVAKVEKTSGGNYNSVKVWFDPSVTSETDLPNGNIALATDLGIASISYVNVRMAANDADDVIRMDEVVIGAAWSDVVPAATSAPDITTQPSPVTVYAGSTAAFTVVASGPQTLAYQWRRGGTNLVDQGNISGSTSAGSTTSTLTLTNVTFADVYTNYDVVVTNNYGAITSIVASLTVLTPADAVSSQVVALGALGFWEFNETNDPALGGAAACDYVGGFNGTYMTNAQNGNAKYDIAGPQPPGFLGFTSTNAGLKTTWNATNSFVALPGINYAGNSATMVAWINPNSYHKESGILFNTRDAIGPVGGNGTNSCGLGFSGVGTNAQGQCPLMALWGNNGWNWGTNSGVFVPTNLWSMVAGVVTPTNITVYVFNAYGMQSGSTNYANKSCSWMVYGTNWIGIDPYDGAGGSFDGSIDDVAFFGYSLSAAQLQSIFLAASNAPAPPTITAQPSPATVNQGSTATFTVVASSSAPLAYNWRRGGTNLVDLGNVSGSTNSALTLSNVQMADATNYCVVVTNSAGSVTSSVVTLTVLSTNFIQISSQPSSVTVNPDQTAQFTVTASTSGSLYYQWFAGLPGSGVYAPLTDGGNISGSSTATLVVSNVVASDWGNYYVQISNADGVVVNSSAVTLSLATWEQAGQGGVVNAVATSPDGAWIASGSDDDTVKLWNVGDGTFARTLAANGPFPVTAVAFSHDSTILAAGYTDGSIRLWNPATGVLVRTINLYWSGKTNNLGKIASLSFSPDGQYLAAGNGDLYTRIWQVSNGTMNQAWVKNAGPMQSVAYSPDGTMLASGSEDKTVQVLNTSGWGNVSGAPMTLGSNVTAVAFSPDGTVLVAGCLDGTITFWQTGSFSTPLRTINNPTGSGIVSLAFGTDGQTLFSGDVSGYITRWAASSWTATATWSAHTNGVGGVRSLAIITDNSKLVSGGADHQVNLWRTTDGTALGNLTGHAGMITRACFSPDGSMMASAGNDGSVRLWAADSGTLVSVLTIHTNQVGAMAFSPDSTLLVSGGGCLDNTLRVFNSSSLALLQTIVAATNGVTALAVSWDSTLVASAGDASEKVIRLWSLKDGSLVQTLAGHTSGTAVLAFSPNGQYLASGGRVNDGTIKLWNVRSGSLVDTFTPAAVTDQYVAFNGTNSYNTGSGTGPQTTYTVVHTCSIQSLAFNYNGTLLASAGVSDGVINIWQTGTGTLLCSLTNMPNGTRSVAFSPDGQYLAAAGSDAIRMWRTSDWQPVWNSTTETVGISSLNFSPNGTFLVFGRDDGTVSRIWNPLAGPINVTLGVSSDGRLNIASPYSPFLSVWASSNLGDPSSWSLLTNVVAATNLVQVADPSPSLPPVRFYRATTPP
jgi:WD40 repeat protein